MILTYGPASPEDVDVLYPMVAELICRYEDFSTLNREKVLAWTRKSMQKNLPFCSRVYREGRLAGFFFLEKTDGKTELDNLFLLPEFRGQGIGTAILKKCIAEAENPLFLYVFRENTGAVRLYERLGFRITQEVSTTRYIMEYTKEGC